MDSLYHSPIVTSGTRTGFPLGLSLLLPLPTKPLQFHTMAQDFSGVIQIMLQKTFLEAAALGNLSVLKKMAKRLDKGDGIKKTIEITKDALGLSAFHFAASHGRTDICRYLIEELGFDPDFRTYEGRTPLFYASMGGKTGTLTYLCNCGADPTCTDKKGDTPLHCAAYGGHGETIELLLSKGVPVDPENHRGTPLHVAAACCHEKAVKILLEHNADLNKVSNEHFTPLIQSIFGGSLDCTNILIKAGADMNLYCPLASAISQNSSETVMCLLAAGADPNVPNEVRLNEYGMLPIEVAAEWGKKGFVEMLLPSTTQLPTVPNWTVEGIINYVKSPAFKKKHEIGRKKRFAELKVKGEQAFSGRQYSAAVSLYARAMEMVPTDATIYANRSICWLRMMDGHLALKDAMKAQSLRPNWPKAYYRIGAAFMLLKRYEEASEMFLDGFKLDPANKDMEKALSEALDCMKKSNTV